MTVAVATECRTEFACFGSRAAVSVSAERNAEDALQQARQRLLAWHMRFTRFDTASELSRMNANPAGRIRVSEVMCTFVATALGAALLTSGLVDPTLVDDIVAAGYGRDLGRPASRSKRPLAGSAPPPRAARTRRPAGGRSESIG